MADKTEVVVRNSGNFFAEALTVLFIGLKLTGQIDWSWWWVLSPLWIGLLVVLGFLGCVLGGAAAWVLAGEVAAYFRKTFGRK